MLFFIKQITFTTQTSVTHDSRQLTINSYVITFLQANRCCMSWNYKCSVWAFVLSILLRVSQPLWALFYADVFDWLYNITLDSFDLYIAWKLSQCNNYPHNRPWRPIALREVEDLTLSRRSAYRWRWVCPPYSPAALFRRNAFSAYGTHF
jgi:hypothetical protein